MRYNLLLVMVFISMCFLQAQESVWEDILPERGDDSFPALQAWIEAHEAAFPAIHTDDDDLLLDVIRRRSPAAAAALIEADYPLRTAQLTQAIEQRMDSTASALITAGCPLGDEQADRQQLLMRAIRLGTDSTTQHLLAQGLDPTFLDKTERGQTLRQTAWWMYLDRSSVNPQVVSAMWAATPDARAWFAQHSELVSRSLQRGPSVFLPLLDYLGDDFRDHQGRSALHLWVPLNVNRQSGADKQDILTALLEHGMALDAEDGDGQTALFAASTRRDRSLEWLLAAGAQVNHRDHQGVTPLAHLAQHYQDTYVESLIRLLLAGADVNWQGEAGESVLHILAQQRRPSFTLFHLLVQAGAPLDRPDNAGRQPIDSALLAQSWEAIAWFEERGASFSLPLAMQMEHFLDAHSYGRVQALLAGGQRKPDLANRVLGRIEPISEIIAAALQAGGDPNLQPEHGSARPIVQLHLEKGHFTVALLLIEAGASVAYEMHERVIVPLDSLRYGRGQIQRRLHSLRGHSDAAERVFWEKEKVLFDAIFDHLVAAMLEHFNEEEQHRQLRVAITRRQMELVQALHRGGVELKPAGDMVRLAGPRNATDHGHEQPMLRWLFAQGIRDPQAQYALLGIAIERGCQKLMNLLFAHDTPINPDPSWEDDYQYRSLLLRALDQPDTDMLKMLLERGADVQIGLPVQNVAVLSSDPAQGAKRPQGYATTALHVAVRKSHLDHVKVLLEAGAPLATLAPSGRTALHYAAANGNLAIVQALLAAGADPTVRTDVPSWARNAGLNDMSVLHVVALPSEGDAQIVDVLVAAGAPLEARNEQGYTPLAYAKLRGRERFVEVLKAHGADTSVLDGLSAPERSAHPVRVAWARHLRSHQRDPQALREALQAIPHPWSAAMPKDEHIFESVVRVHLSSWGSRPNEEQRQQWLEFVAWMIDAGYPLEQVDPQGRRPLHVAVHYKEVELVEKLIAAGADVNARVLHRSVWGRYTPLTLVTRGRTSQDDGRAGTAKKNHAMAELLIAAGADVNLATSRVAPVFEAVSGAWYLLPLYLDAGADLSIQLDDERNIFFFLDWSNRRAMPLAERLIAAGVDAAQLDRRGRSALRHAALTRSSEGVTFLLEHGAHAVLNHIASNGGTPLSAARTIGSNDAVIALLREHGAKTGQEIRGAAQNANEF
ncbi:MAG: hypothetical protein EA401_03410 [Planctomycetota bacterium]|nr:MAG: hypothetical protein EA401_03410 [Planctomycetota bacterium]